MAPVIWADVSVWQPLYDSSYAAARDVISFRVDSGADTDAKAAENWSRIKTDLDNGALACGIGYVVYGRGPNSGITARLRNVFGAVPDPRLAWMIDMESGKGFAGPGDHSAGANELAEALAAWCGEESKVLGYANGGDWANCWPRPPAWMGKDTNRVLAKYGGTQPTGWFAWQYTNGQISSDQGYPLRSPSFGSCDHNIYTGPGGLPGMLATLGIEAGGFGVTTWLPGAKVVDLRKTRGNGPFRNFLGVILHVNVDDNGTTDSFYAAGTSVNPSSVTPNFQVYKSATPANDSQRAKGQFGVHQYLPFDWQPWCQAAGNDTYAAIETAGLVDQPLTDYQLEQCARILTFYHEEMGMPYQLANTDGARGFGTHAMGGASWGGHPCPGTIRTAQRQTILDIAGGEEVMPTVDEIWNAPYEDFTIPGASPKPIHSIVQGAQQRADAAFDKITALDAKVDANEAEMNTKLAAILAAVNAIVVPPSVPGEPVSGHYEFVPDP